MMPPMRARGLAIVLPLAAFAAAGCGSTQRPVTIVVSHGAFATAQEAANAERRVAWFDADPRDDDACTESFAATELKRWLPACLGLPPASVTLSDSLPEAGEAIVMGSRASSSLVARLASGSPPPQQGYSVEVERREDASVLLLEGGDRVGTLYATYALLERLGVRFYGLGDSGVVLPSRPGPWPRKLSLREAPAFATRGFWAWEPRGNPAFFEWMARNRMNLWTSADTAWVPLLEKLGIRLTGGGHGLQAKFLDPRAYFRSHPEWYGLQDGRRSPNITSDSGDNFCTGNPAARGQLARNIASSLATGDLRHADVLELWMLDQGRWCTCPLCRAQGPPTDRLLAVARDVAAAVDSARLAGAIHRPVEERTLAYQETRTPPTRGVPPEVTVVFYPYFRCYAHAFADSACTEINARSAADERDWRTAAPTAPWGVCEYYDVGAFKSLPLVFPHVMASDLRWYRRTGARELTSMHVPTSLWGTWTLHQALLARLSWNPETDPDSFVTAFCQEFYPRVGEEMAAFYRALETASANILALQASAGVYGSAVAGGRLANPATPVFPLRHFRETQTHFPTDDGPDLDEIMAAMTQARASLDRARRLARGPALNRIEEVDRRFAYGEAMFSFYAALIRTAVADRARDGDRARAELSRAREAAERLRGIHDLVQVSASHANAMDGLEASGVRPTYEYFQRLYGR